MGIQNHFKTSGASAYTATGSGSSPSVKNVQKDLKNSRSTQGNSKPTVCPYYRNAWLPINRQYCPQLEADYAKIAAVAIFL